MPSVAELAKTFGETTGRRSHVRNSSNRLVKPVSPRRSPSNSATQIYPFHKTQPLERRAASIGALERARSARRTRAERARVPMTNVASLGAMPGEVLHLIGKSLTGSPLTKMQLDNIVRKQQNYENTIRKTAKTNRSNKPRVPVPRNLSRLSSISKDFHKLFKEDMVMHRLPHIQQAHIQGKLLRNQSQTVKAAADAYTRKSLFGGLLQAEKIQPGGNPRHVKVRYSRFGAPTFTNSEVTLSGFRPGGPVKTGSRIFSALNDYGLKTIVPKRFHQHWGNIHITRTNRGNLLQAWVPHNIVFGKAK